MLKPTEAAAVMGMSPQTLANWRVSGFGPPWSRLGGSVRYDEKKLCAWIESQEGKPRNANQESEREARMAISGRRPLVHAYHRLGRHSTQTDKVKTKCVGMDSAGEKTP